MKLISFKGLVNEIKKYGAELRRYMFLIVFPLLVGIILLAVNRSTVDHQIRINGDLKLDVLENVSDRMLDEVRKVSEYILDDPLILENLKVTIDGTETDSVWKKMRSLSNRLYQYSSKNKNIDKIYLIDPANEWLVDQFGSYQYSSGHALFKAIDTRLATEPSDVPAGWNIINRDYAPPYYIAHSHGAEDTDSQITLVIILRMSHFIELLYQTDAELCCLFNDNCEVSTRVLSHEALDWTSEQAVSELLNKDVKCIYRDGPDFTYLVALATASYYHPIQVILIAFCVYFVVILNYGIIFLLRVSRNKYYRISSMANLIPDEAVLGDSYEDLLQSIQHALITYQQNDQDIQNMLRSQNLRYLLQGHSGQDPAHLLTSCIQEASGYYLATLFISSYGDIWENERSDNQVQTIDLVFRSVFSKFERPGIAMVCTDMYPNYVILFSIADLNHAKDEVLNILEQAILFLEESFQIQMRCIVSEPVSTAGDISKAFEETLDTYQFICDTGNDSAVLFQEELTSNSGPLLGGDYLNQLHVLLNTMLAGKYELVPPMADAIIRKCILPYDSQSFHRKTRTAATSFILTEALYTADLSREELDASRRQLYSVRSDAEALPGTVKAVFSGLHPSATENKTDELVSSACRYIRNNLNNCNLSVSDVCSAVGCSVPHLSRLFRSNKDTTINKFINDQRIALAKKLLTDKRLTITSICTKAGYASMDTFSRNFRRREGMSPSEYRNSHF